MSKIRTDAYSISKHFFFFDCAISPAANEVLMDESFTISTQIF